MENMFEKKIGIIGLGNAGSQVGFLAEQKYPELWDVVYINSSDSDLSMVGDSDHKYRIGENITEGVGADRDKAKSLLRNEITNILRNKKFQEVIKPKRYVFVISSAAGGTGSGVATGLLGVLKNVFEDVHFILIGILPSMVTGITGQGNARRYCDEIYRNINEIGTYIIYDNDLSTEKSPTEALVSVNQSIVEDMRILSGIDNYSTPFESMDVADMERVLTTPGRLVITRLKKGITEKILEDTPIDNIIIRGIKLSHHAELNRDKKIIRWGIITNFTEPVNRLYDTSLESLQNFIGVPIERFNHNAVNQHGEELNFLYFIGAGLSFITDRVKKMDERVAELELAVLAAKPSDYENINGSGSYHTIADNAPTKPNNKNATVDIDSILGKYE